MMEQLTTDWKNVRQTFDHPCPECGSRYRDGDFCANPECRALAPAPVDIGSLPDGNDRNFCMAGHSPRGQDWDKVQHKVVYRQSL